MKVRIAGRHDRWLPPPNRKETVRVRQALTWYAMLFGPERVPPGEKRNTATAMLDFQLRTMERQESANYYAGIRAMRDRWETCTTRQSQKSLRKKREK